MLGGQRTGIAGLINTHEDGASIHAASEHAPLDTPLKVAKKKPLEVH